MLLFAVSIFLNMQTIWVRLNAVVFFSLTVLLAMAIMAAISTSSWNILTDVAKGGAPTIKTLKMRTLRSLRNHNGVDRALFSFDLDAGKDIVLSK